MKWLFLVHQVQTPNSRERVKVWRLIKKLGAVLHRNSVYVLPYSKEHLEDFQWVCQQIRDSKGEASVFISEAQDKKEDRLLRDLFVKNRQKDYQQLLQSAQKLLSRVKSRATESSDSLNRAFRKEESELREGLEQIRRIDFFSAGPMRELLAVLDQLKKQLGSVTVPTGKIPVKRYQRNAFQGKKWATRERIFVDRISSAWLIRRFIDPEATFVFAPETQLPEDAIPFDVFGAEFSHHGEDCTFETLLKAFGFRERALQQIGQIIHDIDLKDRKFGRPEAPGFEATMRALSSSVQEDEKLLEVGSLILDGMYQNLSRSKN